MATVNRSGTPEPRFEPSGASGSAATTNRRPSYPPFAGYYHWNSPRETKGRSMSNCSIENATTLNLSLRLRGGGKVHGSLARAGKVKGQTPKVPKQEDSKKALTGRAKKRWQYNRRFVNVVAGMGGKKLGPNSNAAKN